MRVVQLTIKGNTGQPTVARQLEKALKLKCRVKNVYIDRSSFFRKFLISIGLPFRLRQSPSKFVIHLGVESLFCKLFFGMKNNVVYVNHGIYKFENKLNLLRSIYCFVNWLGARYNNIFFVNEKQRQACSGDFVLYNTPNVEGLIEGRRGCLPIKVIGFVGSDQGQKNTGVLYEAVLGNPDLSFLHMNSCQLERFSCLKNYQWIPQNRRIEFFEKIDVLVLPSIYESFGLIAYEAAFCGIHVIHSGVDGLAQLPFGQVVDSNSSLVWMSTIKNLGRDVPVEFQRFRPCGDVMHMNADNILQCLK